MKIITDKSTGEIAFVLYLGGDAYTTPVIWHSKQDGSASTDGNYYYLHRDYLGSILAITDADGGFKEKRHFDAWGNIVKLEDGNGNALSSFDILDRGYTGHEYLVSVGIINMNGRLYDPLIHRFLSPDNFVQDPYNTQNFNRYGYVLNNPLKYTDPSGEFLIAALIGAAVGVLANGINNSIQGQGFFKGAVKAAIFGAIGGATSFGIGQLASNITSSLGSGVFQSVAHFYTGDFLSGALAGGISSGISSFTGGVLSNSGKVMKAVGIVGSGSVSGGIGSVLGGGNFLDGMRQGAITSGLNHFAHSAQSKLTKYFTHKSKAYDYMWEKSFSENGSPLQEVSGWILDNDDVIVLPYEKNIVSKSYNDALTNKSVNGNKMVQYQGKWHTIKSHVHTHPLQATHPKNPLMLSEGDL